MGRFQIGPQCMRTKIQNQSSKSESIRLGFKAAEFDQPHEILQLLILLGSLYRLFAGDRSYSNLPNEKQEERCPILVIMESPGC